MLLRFGSFAALAVTIMLALIAYSAWRQYTDVRTQQQVMANWTANSLEEWLQGLINQLASAAQNAEIMDAPREQVEAYLNSVLLRSPAFASAGLLDTRSTPPREVLNVSHEGISALPYTTDWLTPTLQLGYAVAPMRFVKGLPMVVVAYAIRQGAQTIGIVAVQADLSQTYHILTLARTERGGYTYAIDQAGRTVLHEDSPFMFSRAVHTEVGAITALIAKKDLPYLYQGLNAEGEQVIGAGADLEPLVPWYVVAEQPIQPLLQDFLPLLYGAGGILLLSFLGSLFVGLFISRRVISPIVQLQEGARRIGSGDLEHSIVLQGRSELTTLAGDFNHMATSLRESQFRQAAWSHELEACVQERTAELSRTLEQLQEESRAKENLVLLVKEMSSPVIPVMEGIIVIPIVGALDSERAQRVMDDLLAGIAREHTRVAILDITGLAVVDTAVANALLQASQAARLLGAEPILVGIAPEVAETLVQLGVEIRHFRTAATLQEGLQMALAMLRRKVVSV
jgi:anti-anti-sigma regulatory factor/HAMP domain-containing protein